MFQIGQEIKFKNGNGILTGKVYSYYDGEENLVVDLLNHKDLKIVAVNDIIIETNYIPQYSKITNNWGDETILALAEGFISDNGLWDNYLHYLDNCKREELQNDIHCGCKDLNYPDDKS
jgi:hypothetical protein